MFFTTEDTEGTEKEGFYSRIAAYSVSSVTSSAAGGEECFTTEDTEEEGF